MSQSIFSQATTTFGDVPNATSGDIYQGYSDTCAIRSQEIILRDFGINISQETLIERAANEGWYDGNGTSPEDVGKLLETYGVPVTRHENANIFNLVSELSQGHKVIVAVDSGELWGNTGIVHDVGEFFGYHSPDHALVVSSIDTSNPNDVKIIVTDPGTGDVAKVYSQQEFLDAWSDSNCFMVTTVEPAPATLPEMSGFDYVLGHLTHFMGMAYDQLSSLCNLFLDMPVGEVADQFVNLQASDFGSVGELAPMAWDQAITFVTEHTELAIKTAFAYAIMADGGDPSFVAEPMLPAFASEFQEHVFSPIDSFASGDPVCGLDTGYDGSDNSDADSDADIV